MANFPGSEASFTGFTPGHTLLTDVHASQHNLEQAEITATQHKVGTGSSTPTNQKLLRGNGTGTSAWAQADLTTDVTGVLPLANGGTSGGSASAAAANLVSEIGKLLFPIGCVYTETTGVNPSTSLGFGTWIAFGAGRTLIGVGTSDAAYAAGATGGESNHILTSAEMPSHTHVQDAHTHAQNGSAGNTPGSAYVAATDTSSARNGMNGSLGVQANDNTTATNQNTGGGGTHNNLPPYLVTYFWKRTA